MAKNKLSIERNCRTCGKAFRVFPCQLKAREGVYCSMDCKWVKRRIVRVCKRCGNEFSVPPCKVRPRNGRPGAVYCSVNCHRGDKAPNPARTEKPCSACKAVKPLSAFNRRLERHLQVQSQCKECMSKIYAARYAAPEYKQALIDTERKRKYGLTPDAYQQLLQHQAGLCAICRRTPHKGRNLCIDHDHQTGKVRGLLCTPCNTVLGRWQDSPGSAQRAQRYLEQHSQLRLVG